MSTAQEDADEALAIVERIRPILAGRGPEIQGAVMVELLSMYLAGYYMAGQAGIDLVLDHTIKTVRQMVPVNVEILKEQRHAPRPR